MRFLRVLTLLAALLAAVGCTLKPGTHSSGLRWTGEGLQGLTLVQRQMEQVTVHYTPPTAPEEAEAVGRQISFRLTDLGQSMGRLGADERIHVWILPAGSAWPAGLGPLPPGRLARAAGQYHVVVRQEAVDLAAGGGLRPDAGLVEAFFVAVRPGAGSPAMQAGWAHEGMAALLARGWDGFPVRQWQGAESRPISAADAMALLSAKELPEDFAQWRRAAEALSAMLVDRFGVHWAERAPELAGFTPAAALRWVTAADTDGVAVARWQERIDHLTSQTHTVPGTVGSYYAYIPTAADISPIRAEPVLAKLPVGPGPNANHSPHAYDLDVRYEPGRRLVAGTVALHWENGEGIPVDTLYFHLWPNAEQYARLGAGIRVESVTVDGKEARFTADYLDLAVPLGRALAPGERVTVKLRFATVLPARISQRVLGQEQQGRFNLAHWFPILAVLDDRGWNLHPLPGAAGEPYSENAQFSVKLDVPAGWTVGATGRLAARHELGDRWVYEYDAPNVKDWVATGGRGLSEYVLEQSGVKIRVIDSDAEWSRAVAEITAQAIPLFTAKFGPYPYPELVITCCAGLEYPGLFYTTRQDQNQYWKVVTWHELGHQWFYGIVGNDQFTEAWLDEGFTRYAERLAVRAFGPEHLLRRDYAMQVLPNLLRVTSSSAEYHVVNRQAYAVGVYNKPAIALEELERLLGEARFEQLIREYVQRFQFKTATTADFVALAEEIGGQGLQGFFRTRLIEPGDRVQYRPVLPPGQMVPGR